MLKNGDQRIKQSLMSFNLKRWKNAKREKKEAKKREKYNQINDLLWVGKKFEVN